MEESFQGAGEAQVRTAPESEHEEEEEEEEEEKDITVPAGWQPPDLDSEMDDAEESGYTRGCR